LPQLWFRNIWSWQPGYTLPTITYLGDNTLLFQCEAGEYHCYFEGSPKYLFTNNDTNAERLYRSTNESPFVKDGINNCVVNRANDEVNDLEEGTKVAAWYQVSVPKKSSIEIKFRLTNNKSSTPFKDFDDIFNKRIKEADDFFENLPGYCKDVDEQRVQRQAWAGILWNKQYYHYDVNRWLNGDNGQPPPPKTHTRGRNHTWKHFASESIISMPDKWEYPWFAAWDLAFHCIAIAPVDPDFAKQQLRLLVRVNYMHPSGQLPAYEWDFSDVNPPVHAMAAWNVFCTDKSLNGTPDYYFLEEIFQKLLLNFTWWVNRKDSEGNNIFEGGFLGLDNIGVFNRSQAIPGGGHLEQADGTSWMASYALTMMQVAMELSLHNPVYENMAIKFAEHFLYIAGAITSMGEDCSGLWDEEDGFYYDLMRKPNGSWSRLKLRTLVGLIPMIATIIFDEGKWCNLPRLKERLEQLNRQRPDLAALVSNWKNVKGDSQHLLSLLRGHRMKLLLRRMLDKKEFLSEYGVRSISKVYEQNPFKYFMNGEDYSVKYTPAESDSNMFGGNSNWRGPIWMPINYLLIQSLYKLHEYYTDDFRVEYPTASGEFHSLSEIADALGGRLKSIFLKNEKGERPVNGGNHKFNFDPHFKDYVLFYEYFDGDSGKGLGASHQTGWTALVSVL
jgi:hypothetical protein